MLKYKQLTILLCAITISGCASKLTTFDSPSDPTKGIRVAGPILVETETTITYKAIAGHEQHDKWCTKETIVKYEVLPFGHIYYINFDPALIADGDFKLELTDSGTLKLVSLNSDASSGLEQAKGILEAVLPYVKAPAGLGASAADSKTFTKATAIAKDLKKQHCLIAKTVSKITKEVKIGDQ